MHFGASGGMGVHVNPGLHSISSSQQSPSLTPHFSFLVFGSKLIYIGKEIKGLLDIQLMIFNARMK